MTVILLMGGVSPERDISLQSGQQVHSALLQLGHNVTVIDPQNPAWLNEIKMAQKQHPTATVFNILHGGEGENGAIRSVVNAIGLPCTGSDAIASAIAMDKPLTKEIWQNNDIPTPAWQVYSKGDNINPDSVIEQLGLPLFVKPASGGSSTHAGRVDSTDQLPTAIEHAASEDGLALVEQLIEGTDYTLSVLGEQALPLIKIETAGRFYDYHAKYESDETKFICPSGLPDQTAEEFTRLGLQAFNALRCRGWGRVDFIVDTQNRPHFLEVNTIPGMTSHSLVPMAAKANGIDFSQLVQHILETAS